MSKSKKIEPPTCEMSPFDSLYRHDCPESLIPSAFVPSLPDSPGSMAQKLDPNSLTGNGKTIESMLSARMTGMDTSHLSSLDKHFLARNSQQKAGSVAQRVNESFKSLVNKNH